MRANWSVTSCVAVKQSREGEAEDVAAKIVRRGLFTHGRWRQKKLKEKLDRQAIFGRQSDTGRGVRRLIERKIGGGGEKSKNTVFGRTRLSTVVLKGRGGETDYEKAGTDITSD